MARWITEMGMGVDVHGGDYTKAAKRAVSDALRHSSLNFFRVTGRTPQEMRITVHLGARDPAAIDREAVAAELPYGTVTVEPEPGGLNVPAEVGDDLMVIVNAAILVHFDDD